MISIEICAGAGGQALGLEQAGFAHAALVEIDAAACATLRLNRPQWNVIQSDVHGFSGYGLRGCVDLLAGGVPCPPFSRAGKQLGSEDERDLFPQAIRLADEIRPNAIMLENVRGLLDGVFNDYRHNITEQLRLLGYRSGWRLLNACDYGVSQLRPRVVLVAIKSDMAEHFSWPEPQQDSPLTVGRLLFDLMMQNGWKMTHQWRDVAHSIAPTIVGGSKKHGGPDLGPTRARKAWATLGVDGRGIADAPPDPDFVGMPRLTNRMVARIQGFPDCWAFSGKKTSVYRQIGNAFPPPVARAVGVSIRKCLQARAQSRFVRVGD